MWRDEVLALMEHSFQILGQKPGLVQYLAQLLSQASHQDFQSYSQLQDWQVESDQSW